MVSALEPRDWQAFLGRSPLPPPPDRALDALRGQTVLITGTGSIGSALALRLHTMGIRLVLLESSESHVYALQQAFALVEQRLHPASAAFVLGSAGDAALLDEVFATHAPRIVFHAAAFKHVPLLEEHPLAAIENNVFGTHALAAAAGAAAAHVVLLSTDKAVAPASIMGATKRAAEQIVLAAGGTVLRLGNVLASRDSVAEIFSAQIEAGGPLTVTGPFARRYFLTLDEAVNLLLAAVCERQAPCIFAPALSAPHFIVDLAAFLARTLAPGVEIPVVFTQPRPGDRETEMLWSPAERAAPADDEGLVHIHSPRITGARLHAALSDLRDALDARDLAGALDRLRTIVPDYTPSAVVQSALLRVAPRAAR